MADQTVVLAEDPGYDEFIAACAKDCFCCDICGNQIPCAGTMAGGICDRVCQCRTEAEIDCDEDNDDE
jgi:hypothetical protein